MFVKSEMSEYPLTILPEESISNAHKLMSQHKIRHLPVVTANAKMVGLITESDIFLTFMKLFGAREKGVRITLECPYRSGELAKITKAIADLGGILVSCGTIHLKDINKGKIILKVRNVDHQLLTDALSKIEEIDIIDNRKA